MGQPTAMCQKAYFDTSAWNHLVDHLDSSGAADLARYEVTFSSCNLDEFSLAPPERAVQLAAFAWQHSNRTKLLDHIELAHAEISQFLEGRRFPSIYDFDDEWFPWTWKLAREGKFSDEFHERLHESLRPAKEEFRDYDRLMRHVFREPRELLRDTAERLPEIGWQARWEEQLEEFYDDGYVAEFLWTKLGEVGNPPLRLDRSKFFSIDFRSLPGTAAHMEYFLFLAFGASFGTGKVPKPDLGDQADFRQAAYAGVMDIFVTSDDRMYKILTEMVKRKRARILKTEEFLKELGPPEGAAM